MDTASEHYKRAFEAYLRRGVPIELSLKQLHPTAHYIWRTRGVSKVRSSHADNNGKIFSWESPPPTGHPGEDYGCRCTAEAYSPQLEEHIAITMSGVSDAVPPWTSQDFVDHYFNGRGRSVKVREIGHLHAIVAEYQRIVIGDLSRLPAQIAQKSRLSNNGSFSDQFERPYEMTGVVFSIGDTTIGGKFSGNSSGDNGVLSISGKLDFYLKDEFTDPLDIGVEVVDPGETIYENIHRPLEERIRRRINRINSNQFKQRKRDRLGIHTGDPYPITDQWSGQFEGQIYADASSSVYG